MGQVDERRERCVNNYIRNFAGELDVVSSSNTFKLVMSVEVDCVYRDGDYDWYTVDDFDESEFPGLLPTVYKRGVLVW